MFAQPLPAAGEVDLVWCPSPTPPPQQRRASLDALLRGVLAAYLGCEPQRLEFGREPAGRPYLRNADPSLAFNLSDTRGGSVVAVAVGLRVGVDLERLDRQPPALRLARRYFNPEESAVLERLAPDQQRLAFLHAWTAKESSCKATGSGLRDRLSAWRFEIDPIGADPRVRGAPAEAGDPQRWSLRRITPAPGFTAVVAAAGAIRRVRLIALDALPQAS